MILKTGGGSEMIDTNLLFCVKYLYKEEYCGVEHSHPCYEIVYYCDGAGEVMFNKKKYRFSKDHFMVCPPEVKHIERGGKNTKVLYIGFELYGDLVLSEGLFAEKDYHILEYLEKIYYEVTHRAAYSDRLINLYCTIIAIQLADRTTAEREIVFNHNLDNVAGYISANYRENINVKKLANIAGYSYDHFRKAFFKRFGVSVNDFILQKRIDAANEMLQSGKYLVKEIAADCGFSSVSQFCTKYREVTGVSPKKFQKKDDRNLGKDKFSG